MKEEEEKERELALIKILINTHQGNFTKMVFNARQPQSNALTLISAIQSGDSKLHSFH